MMMRRRTQKEVLERITERLTSWQSTLDDCNETLSKCEVRDVPDLSHAHQCVEILEVQMFKYFLPGALL